MAMISLVESLNNADDELERLDVKTHGGRKLKFG
jgi:hypothetical protein